MVGSLRSRASASTRPQHAPPRESIGKRAIYHMQNQCESYMAHSDNHAKHDCHATSGGSGGGDGGGSRGGAGAGGLIAAFVKRC